MPGKIIRSSWGAEVVTLLENALYNAAVDYSGYVHRSLTPEADLALNLGARLYRFHSMYSGYGEFSYGLTVQGRAVLKDGDPIFIEDIYSPARQAITQSINDSYVYSKLVDIEQQLITLQLVAAPTRLGLVVNQAVPADTDIFPADLPVVKDGKVRVKAAPSDDVYMYLKWLPKGEAAAVVAALNLGAALKAGAWHEFDFTVNRDDYVNVRVSPGTTLTLAVFNIGGG